MIIKDNSRTTWSSMTVNIEIFKGDYHFTFSPIELILRGKYNYSVWHFTNFSFYQ